MAFKVSAITAKSADGIFQRSNIFRVEMDAAQARTGGELVVEVRGHRVTVKMPANVSDGARIRLPNCVNDGTAEEKPERDAYLFIKVSPASQRISLKERLLRLFRGSGLKQDKENPEPRSPTLRSDVPPVRPIENEFRNVFFNKTKDEHERIIAFWKTKKRCTRVEAMRHAIDDLLRDTRSWR